MTEIQTHHFATSDGCELAWHELGEGRPLLLLHGLFSNAHVNWIKFGTAARLAAAGFRCHMLDFRAHGDSEGPADPARWPANVLARDLVEWTRHLAYDDYDLGGFSLGGRTSVHGAIQGLTPRRLAICGMGLKGIANLRQSTDWFIDTVRRRSEHAIGSDAYFAIQFMKTNGVDPDAALNLLAAQVDADTRDIAALTMPARAICGVQDHYFADAKALAELMPTADFVEIPGTHMSSVSKPEFGEALAGFFSG